MPPTHPRSGSPGKRVLEPRPERELPGLMLLKGRQGFRRGQEAEEPAKLSQASLKPGG